MKRFSLIHPYLFLFGSILYEYCFGAIIISSPDQIIRPLAILVSVLLILEFPARWLARDWDGASLLLLVFVLGFCGTSRYSFSVGVAIVLSLFIWFLGSYLRKIPVTMARVNGIISFVGLVFLVTYMVAFIRDLPTISSHPTQAPVDLKTVASSPDIYYIVLDGYGRADVLSTLYNYDNSSFITALRARGFIVPQNDRSNYPKTALSVTSTLNMDYIDDFAPGLEDYPYWWLMAPYLDHSRVSSLLEQIGYQSVSITTDWGITDNPTTDVYYSPRPVVLSDFENFFISTTPLGFIRPLISSFVYYQSYARHRELIRFNFETLSSLPAQPGPKFIFAHILAPHPPFVFDANGNPLQPAYPFSFNDATDFPDSDEVYRQGYVEQVKFVNGQILAMVDAILRDSKTPPIIILQGDHGPAMFTDFNSPDDTCLFERFSPFAAYYLPGADQTIVPDTITPVNLFRIIFNRYFSADFPLLADRQYYSSGIYIFRLEDVTARAVTCTMP